MQGKKCELCKQEFHRGHKGNKFCSKKCYNRDNYLKYKKPQRAEENARGRAYYQKNKEKEKLRTKRYDADNAIKVQKRKRDWRRRKYASDKNFRISLRLRSLVGHAFREYSKAGKTKTAKKYGIDYGAIIEHLKPFPENIENYHIDHIIPLCSFDLTKQSEIDLAFSPENHQWLTAEENFKKGGM